MSALYSPWAILAVAAGYILYTCIMAPYDHFAKRGVVFQKPWPVLGTMGTMILRQESMFDMVVNSYNQFKGKR